LRYESLTEEEKKMYDRFQENRRIENSVSYTAKQERNIEIARNAILEGADNTFIAKITGLTIEQIEKLCAELKKMKADNNIAFVARQADGLN
jgi:CRISPR/Cas system type I-B associated protein Csh2 (Cas7 group RAMP superfamily)